MVLCRDVDLARAEVFDGMVPATVAELELVGLAAKAVGEDLVTEANSKDRNLADEVFDLLVNVSQSRGISRAVGEENPIRIFGEDLTGRSAGIDDFDLEARLAERAEDVVFDPEVVGHDTILYGRKIDIIGGLIGGDTWNGPEAGFAFPEVSLFG